MKITELNLSNFQQINELRRSEREQASVPDKLSEVGHAAAVAFLKSVPTNELSNYAVTMTDLPKVGVNPQSEHDTPIGIYFYPAKYYIEQATKKGVPYQHDAPYIQILKITTDQILHVSGMTEPEYKRDVQKLLGLDLITRLPPGDQDKVQKLSQESGKKSKIKKSGGKLWYVTWKLSELLQKRYHKESPIIWNWMLRQLGYKVVIDLGSGIIHENEPTQGVILAPIGSYQWIKTIENRSESNLKIRQDFKKNFNKMDFQQKGKFVQSLSDSDLETYLSLYPVLARFITDPAKFDPYLTNFRTAFMIKYIKNPSEEQQEKAVRTNPNVFPLIKNPSEKIQKIAVQEMGINLEHIPNPSEELINLALDSDGMAIEFVKTPTEYQKRIAVNNYGLAIWYIPNPSKDLQKEAVLDNPAALMGIKNPDPEVIDLGLRASPYTISNLKNPSDKLKMDAIGYHTTAFNYIKDPSEQVQMFLAEKTSDAVNMLLDRDIIPSQAVIDTAIRSFPKKKSSIMKAIKRYQAQQKEEADN